MTRWVDTCFALRDGLLASPRFQRWAAGFPLTRPIAQRRMRALFDLCAGFVYSQVLFACVRLGLFEILAEGPQTSAALCDRLSLSPEATERLLRAAVSLGLVARRGGDRYGLGAHGAALVGNPGISAMIEHHCLLYADLRDPVALLRGEAEATELSGYWPYTDAERPGALEADRIAPYTALMAASLPMVAAEVLDAYPVHRHRCLLDVGGGDGSFLLAAAARAPELGLMLFDLPPVADRAKARFAAAGAASRLTVETGDFRSDPLPLGADLITLIRVLHDHDDDAALEILRAARRALPEEGCLLIGEPMAGAAGAAPVGDAYFGFYLLAMGRGRARRPEELRHLLKSAGFSRFRGLRTRSPLLAGVVLAQP